jgi:hypothetical protein
LGSDTGLLVLCIGSIHQFEATLSDLALLRFKLLNESQLLRMLVCQLLNGSISPRLIAAE